MMVAPCVRRGAPSPVTNTATAQGTKTKPPRGGFVRIRSQYGRTHLGFTFDSQIAYRITSTGTALKREGTAALQIYVEIHF